MPPRAPPYTRARDLGAPRDSGYWRDRRRGADVGAVQAHGLVDLILDGDYLPFITFTLSGVFAFSRRPDHPVARRLLSTGTGLLGALTIGRLASYAVLAGTDPSDWFWLANTTEQLVELSAFASLVSLFVLFPDGHYERPYERVTVTLARVIVPLVPILELLLLPTLHLNNNVFTVLPSVPSPLFVPPLAAFGDVAADAFDARIALVPLAAGLLALRYGRMPPEGRVQARWPLLAVLAYGVVGVGPVRGLIEVAEQWGALPSFTGTLAYQLTNAFVPLALLVGLLRYRLLDLEVIVRRSLVYGVVWLAIALAYVMASASLGLAIGDRVPVGVAVLCTIVAAVAFEPARRWLERVADRWVFGERYGGYVLVAQFGAGLEQTIDPAELAARLASTVRVGLRVRWARVVLGDCVTVDGLEPGVANSAELSAPLVHHRETIGAIECGSRTDDMQFTIQDRQLLLTLGRQAALSLRNAHLTTALSEQLEWTRRQARELAASRSRIIEAENAARRRIERDLHDGVQQDLVAMLAKLGLARTRLVREPTSAGLLVAELQEDARQVIHELRELVRGIHSPVLADRGLLEAVESRVARLPLSVRLETDGLRRGMRMNRELEAAAYFVVSEGLTNTLKHADAHEAQVRFALRPNELAVELEDDGRGFEPGAREWSGLQGLADRVEALGGRLEVNSRPGNGTRLTARLPLLEP